MATTTRKALKPRPLGRGSFATLMRLGEMQNREGGAVPVAALIDIQSRLEWGYVQAMLSRALVQTVPGERVALTRAGWATYRRHRS